jgi:hypothetical protein
MSAQLRVTAVAFDGSSVALVTGHVPGYPDRVTTIGVDARMAQAIDDALQSGEKPVAVYEAWQVLL